MRYSSRFVWHFEVVGVSGGQDILIHPANHAAKELKGCIAPVLQHTGEGKGTSSRMALQRLKDRLYPLLERCDKFYLTIKYLTMKKLISRLLEPTPRFFQKIRNFGLVLTGVSAVITTAVIPLPAVLITLAGYTALAGGIASVLSQTAIKNTASRDTV